MTYYVSISIELTRWKRCWKSECNSKLCNFDANKEIGVTFVASSMTRESSHSNESCHFILV